MKYYLENECSSTTIACNSFETTSLNLYLFYNTAIVYYVRSISQITRRKRIHYRVYQIEK